jgi:Family of unknown function (DUF6152)
MPLQRWVATLVALALSKIAVAHHSYTGYDRTGSQTISGTVVRTDWSNPHVHFWVVTNPIADSAQQQVYAFEVGSVSLMTRFGWTKSTFKIGEKVTVTFFPLMDGRSAGAFIKARHEDGTWSTGDLAGANYFSR